MSPRAGDVRQRARALMERVLRAGATLEAEYPLVFREGSPGRLHSVEEGGEARSACAVLVRDALAGGRRMRLGLIGSVSTDPAWRRRGLASRVLDAAESDLAADGCLLALLWADDPDFYRGRGYHPLGAEVDFVLEPQAREALPQATGVVRAAGRDDFAAIHRLYAHHRERSERSPEETAELLAGPGIELLVLQRERDIAAYTCLGRGADFARTIHEWAGAPEDVLALCREHLGRAGARGEGTTHYLMTPPSARELQSRLRQIGCWDATGILGMGKLLDPEAAAALLAESLGPAARVDVESEPLGAARITLRGPAGACSLDEGALLRLLFPPAEDRSELARVRSATGLSLAGLPLPLFLWGLDSI